MGVRAIDVSVHQGPIDWRAVAGDGVQAAWIKVGGADGGLYKDSRADENVVGAQAAGLPFGTYYFCSPGLGDAVTQARHAVACGHGAGKLWPAADLEINPAGISRQDLDVWLATFCAEVQRLTGRDSIWYGNTNVGVGYTAQAPTCPIWIANYGRVDTAGTTPPDFQPALPPAWRAWDVWQFNSVTHVAGITQNTCDQNVVTDEFWAQMTADPTQAPEEDDDMATLVIATTRPDSKWFVEEAGGEAGKQGIFKMLSTDQFVRHMAPDEVEGNLKLRDWIVANGGKDYIQTPGVVDDWMFSDRTLLPRSLPAGNATSAPAVSLTAEQLTELGQRLGVDLAKDVADELAHRLEA